MNVEDFFPIIKTNFENKELNDLVLDKEEKIPIIKGELLKHQKFIARFLSVNSFNNKLILIHNVGTGKSCSAFALSESIMNEDPSYGKTLVITPNTEGQRILSEELVFKCTDGTFKNGEYKPENYESFNMREWLEIQKNNYMYLNINQKSKLNELPYISFDTDNKDTLFIDIEKLNEEYEKLNKDDEKLKSDEIKERILRSDRISEEFLHKWKLNSDNNKWYYNNIYDINKYKELLEFDWMDKFNTIKEQAPSTIPLKNMKSNTSTSELQKNIKKIKSGEKVTLKENIKSRLNKLNRNVRERYDMYTQTKFFSSNGMISKYKDTDIIKTYSKRVIIVDEAHKLLEPMIYENAYKFFHLVKDCKILFLSATPIKDKITDFPKFFNLLLNENLPTDSKFIKTYFNTEDIPTKLQPRTNVKVAYSINKEKEKELGEKVGSLVSFLKSQKNIQTIYVGKPFENITKYNIYISYMNDFQSKHYLEVFNKDNLEKHEKKDAAYKKSVDASLFVAPNGKSGDKGNDNFDKQDDTEGTWGFFKKTIKAMKSIDEKIEYLSKYSCKYAEIIKSILKHPRQNMFIFSERINGGGTNLFGNILKLFGLTNNLNSSNDYNRFIIFTGDSDSDFDIKSVKGAAIMNSLVKFNSPENKNGKYIRIIIGSKMVSEMYSFKNIRQIHILTPEWNMASLDQVIGRGIRYGSHKDLPIEERNVSIYLHCAIAKDNVDKSIDYIKYYTCQIKDIPIKQLEYLCKIYAVDCQYNKKRNEIKDIDGSRECEYNNCEYKCMKREEKKELEHTNYNLLYSNTQKYKIKQFIINLFTDKFEYTFEEIFNILKMYKLVIGQNDIFIILDSLNELIENHIFKNKYGFSSYLCESNNTYFLTSTKYQYNKDMLYYTINPISSMQYNFEDMYKKYQISLAEECNDDIVDLIQDFNQDYIKETLKVCIIISLILKIKNKKSQEIINRFKSFINENNGLIILSYFGNICIKPDPTLSFNKLYKSWKPCPEIRLKKKIILDYEPLGDFIGSVSGGKFRLFDIKQKIKSKNALKCGTECATGGSSGNRTGVKDIFKRIGMIEQYKSNKKNSENCRVLKKIFKDRGLLHDIPEDICTGKKIIQKVPIDKFDFKNAEVSDCKFKASELKEFTKKLGLPIKKKKTDTTEKVLVRQELCQQLINYFRNK